jgi:hypothetical protein
MRRTKLLLLGMLLFSLLPISAVAGSKDKTFSVPTDVLYDAAVRTAAHEYKLTNSEGDRRRFSFHTGASVASWGMNVKAHVESLSETSSRLILLIENSSNQTLSWGAGGRMADDFFKAVETAAASWQPVQYGFTMVKPAESKSLAYDDDTLNVVFGVSRKGVTFTLKNKTEGPLKIDWNQWSYVDVDGKSHKVFHRGVAYKDKETSLPPSTIPPTAALEDLIVPTDSVVWSNAENGYRTLDLLPHTPDASTLVGKTLSVFMPLEVNGSVKNYLFSFKITNVQVTSKVGN